MAKKKAKRAVKHKAKKVKKAANRVRAKKSKASRAHRSMRAPKPLRMKIIRDEMICPACKVSITLPYEVEDGEIINCPDCEAELQVLKVGKNVSLRKLETDYGAEEQYEMEETDTDDYE